MAHQFTIKLLVFALINTRLFRPVLSTTPEYYENYVINEGQIRSFETPSVQNCIHKCQLDNQCNIANLKVLTASKFQCVFVRVECFEDLHGKMQQSNGWYVYKLPEKYCKAHPKQQQNNGGSSSNETASTNSSTGGTTESSTGSGQNLPCVGGSFYLKHKSKGKCFHYNTATRRLVLRGACSEAFCETSSKYLYHLNTGKCLKAISDNAGSQITLSSDCSTNKADFHHKTNNLIFYKDTQLCVWQQQSDNPPENSLLTLRSGCNAQETNLLFEKKAVSE